MPHEGRVRARYQATNAHSPPPLRFFRPLNFKSRVCRYTAIVRSRIPVPRPQKLPGLKAKTTGVKHNGHRGFTIAGFINQEGSNAESLCPTWRRLGRALSVLYPRPAVCAPGGIAPTRPRFLDRVLGCHRLRGPGDDGPAVRPHSAPPLRHRTVGRRRYLPLSPPDVADRGRSGAGTPDHSICPPAGTARAAQLFHGAVARTLCRTIDILADRVGRDGLVAGEVEHPV